MPAGQEPCGVQLAWLTVSLYVPAAQAVQIRFVVVVPAAETYWLGTQLEWATQTVAELASLSHVPVAHGTSGATSPAQ